MHLNNSNNYHTEVGDVLLVTLVTSSPGAEMSFNMTMQTVFAFFLNIKFLHCSFMWKELIHLLVIFSRMVK